MKNLALAGERIYKFKMEKDEKYEEGSDYYGLESQEGI